MKRDNGFDKDPERARAAGRKSRRKSWTKILEENRDYIKNTLGVEDTDQLALQTLIKLMQEGDLRAVTEYWDRIHGKATQPIDQKTEATIEVRSPIADAIKAMKQQGE